MQIYSIFFLEGHYFLDILYLLNRSGSYKIKIESFALSHMKSHEEDFFKTVKFYN